MPYLKKVLEECKSDLRAKGFKVEINIFQEDFILKNQSYIGPLNLFTKKPNKYYHFIISNPPYFKLSGKSRYSKIMPDLIWGQPNIYAIFMALSACMLAEAGEMVFITPRSFCSGLYYKAFRKWFLQKVRIERIHIFESRKEVFAKDRHKPSWNKQA